MSRSRTRRAHSPSPTKRAVLPNEPKRPMYYPAAKTKLSPTNTDGGGFIRDLLRHFPDGIGDKRILLMGAGGAARAVACAIADEQPAAFYLSNRTRQKAEALAEMTGATVIPDVATMDRPLDIIVNASAAGHEGKGMPFPPNCRGALAYDLSYGAAAQPFIRQALDGGAARAVDGSGMLAWQAALSFALWEGILPTVSPAPVRARRRRLVGQNGIHSLFPTCGTSFSFIPKFRRTPAMLSGCRQTSALRCISWNRSAFLVGQASSTGGIGLSRPGAGSSAPKLAGRLFRLG